MQMKSQLQKFKNARLGNWVVNVTQYVVDLKMNLSHHCER